MSLRLKLALSIATIAALVAASAGFVVYQQERSSIYDQARASAVAQLNLYVQAQQQGAPVDAIYESRGTRVPTIPAALRDRLTTNHIFTMFGSIQGQPFVFAGTRLRSGDRIYAERPFATDVRSLADLRNLVLVVCVSAGIAGALIGVVVSILIGRPLRRSASLARRLATGDLEARLRPTGNDEIAQLGRALDEMAEVLGAKLRELDESAERERRFSSDVAHELRTPVAGLVAAAALLDDSSTAARMVRERAATLAALVEDLLEVMRLESPAEKARLDEFDLIRLVTDVARSRVADAIVIAPSRLRVASDPRRIERVLANLLDNALRHGRPPISVRVVATGPDVAISVRDAGSGFGAFLPYAGERFALATSSRGGGTGLGLAICAGQARLLGGSLTLVDDHGAVATLNLSGCVLGASAPVPEPAL